MKQTPRQQPKQQDTNITGKKITSGRLLKHVFITSRKECIEILFYISSLLLFPVESIDALYRRLELWCNSLPSGNSKEQKDKKYFLDQSKKLKSNLMDYNKVLNEARSLKARSIMTPEQYDISDTTIAWIYSVKKLLSRYNTFRNKIQKKINRFQHLTHDQYLPGIWDTMKTIKYMQLLKGPDKLLQNPMQSQRATQRDDKGNVYVRVRTVYKQQVQAKTKKSTFTRVYRPTFFKDYLPTYLEYFLPTMKNNPGEAYAFIVSQTSSSQKQTT